MKQLKNSILMILFSGFLYAGTDGTIRGQIADTEGGALPGAQIFIPELSLGAIADANGNYIILNIPVGDYDVIVMMMGYQKQTMKQVNVIMDQTLWLNFKLPLAVIEGDEVEVYGEKQLVEKGQTSRKVTVDSETIESLPIRDLGEVYSLQSGVVKVQSRTHGIPDYEEKGLEELHVQGGRSGEIAYMMDGMYLRNPIYNVIGSGTRLNLMAIKELDWQPGGFNAEYGDAMSAVSNIHTKSGGENFSYGFRFETSNVGASLGSRYDELRGYDDISIGMGGPIFGINNLTFWLSGQYTNNASSSVFEFDNKVYQALPNLSNDRSNFDDYMTVLNQNKENLVQPWDLEKGFRGFGFRKTWDIFGKLTYKPTNKIRINGSYWQVANHQKVFNPSFMFWNDGQTELFQDTYRGYLEYNQTLTSRTFFTVRATRFIQDRFLGVRWQDSDDDGRPDWFEWRHSAGPYRNYSDPYNPNSVPYSLSDNGDTLFYSMVDSRSGWYVGAEPGLYNWDTAEDFTDLNGNGIWDPGEPWVDRDAAGFTDGQWDGPELVVGLYERDGSFWLEPEMYEDPSPFTDWQFLSNQIGMHPSIHPQANPQFPTSNDYLGSFYTGLSDDPFYYMPSFGGYTWIEGSIFGGNSYNYNKSRAETNEIRLDVTSQITDALKIRAGFDYKSHKLDFYEVSSPWLGEGALLQTFAEFWEDTGPDSLLPTDDGYEEPDRGEGNNRYDAGEPFADANGNGEWDSFREPEEISLYVQNIFEVPWMVVNAGIRIDAVNYNTQVWADTSGKFSPGRPWFYSDSNDNGKWDKGSEEVSNLAGLANQKVLFTDTKWSYQISPRLGFSHVITDQATFTFNYGLYFQTPVYQNVFLRTNMQEDPEALFESTSNAVVGNASMSAQRTESYSFAFNIQFNQHWAFTLGGYNKNTGQNLFARTNRSGVYEYKVFSNGDYGSSRGLEFTLQNKGMRFNTMVQYTYSVSKANSAYDWASVTGVFVDAPSQEFRMPYDRPHDFTISVFTRIPLGIRAGLTGFYESGSPYTPMIFNGRDPQIDSKNPYSKRQPAFKNVNLLFTKAFQYMGLTVNTGVNIYNVFNLKNELDVYALTGTAADPGEFYEETVGLPSETQFRPSSYYDRPWMYYPPRQINFYLRVDFK
ncbi:MAG: TonB-dependent receptor [Candidatus Marinimicrobia bacterium]|nr:TonB-dependent receptor [Candidatus Neomarinimicrobiota bacterium]